MTTPDQDQLAPHAGATDHAIPTKPERILVADDEHLVASGLAASLRELGFEVVGPAPDGEAAIELCRTERPDLALLDIRMPRCDGIDAARVIFTELGVPVIIFSAYSDAEYLQKGNEVGIFNYLLKPVSRDQLRVGVSVAWGRYLDHLQQNDQISDLRQRLENRKVIEQAKWILVKGKGITEPDAMRLLQRQARNNRRPLVEVARSVLENEDLLG